MIEITEQLGNRIRELRLAKGLSQERFALSIEMDRTYFSSVESGKRNIAIKNIEKIINSILVNAFCLIKFLSMISLMIFCFATTSFIASTPINK